MKKYFENFQTLDIKPDKNFVGFRPPPETHPP